MKFLFNTKSTLSIQLGKHQEETWVLTEFLANRSSTTGSHTTHINRANIKTTTAILRFHFKQVLHTIPPRAIMFARGPRIHLVLLCSNAPTALLVVIHNLSGFRIELTVFKKHPQLHAHCVSVPTIRHLINHTLDREGTFTKFSPLKDCAPSGIVFPQGLCSLGDCVGSSSLSG